MNPTDSTGTPPAEPPTGGSAPDGGMGGNPPMPPAEPGVGTTPPATDGDGGASQPWTPPPATDGGATPPATDGGTTPPAGDNVVGDQGAGAGQA